MSYTKYGCACAQCASGNDPLDALHAGSSWASQPTTVVAYAYTGDYRVDVLLDDSDPFAGPVADYRWNDGSALGSPVTVTYSFMTAAPYYGGDTDAGATGQFSPFTQAQKVATREIMSRLGAELGITLVEAPTDTTFSYGQIRLGNNMQPDTAGYAWLPNSGDEKSGDVWIDNSGYLDLNHVTPGTESYATLLHEIGHALGLKHPGNYNAGDSSSQDPGNYLAESEDNYNFTLMSYTGVWGGQERDWYGMYDLLALKALYGEDPNYNAGNDTYTFTDNDGEVLKIIDDASGYDTIDLSAVSVGADIDLRPGGFSSIGRNGQFAAQDNVSIDATTSIEHLLGTSFADTVVLPVGTLDIDGRGGIDTLGLSQPRSSYQVTKAGASLNVVRDSVNVTLTNVERLLFADQKFAFDFDGNAGLTAKILGAVFGQGASPNPQYASVGLSYLDGGMDYNVLMQGAIDFQLAQLGLQHTPEAVVGLLYTNLAGFAPSANDVAYFTGLLANHTFTETSLAVAAADSEYNIARIDFVGQSLNGLAYA